MADQSSIVPADISMLPERCWHSGSDLQNSHSAQKAVEMVSLPVTSIFAAVFALSLVGLSFQISLRRLKVKTMIGNGQDDLLQRRIRAQGNFIEYVPMGLIGLGLTEAQTMSVSIAVVIGVALGAGRLLHAYGMLRPSDKFRGFGMILTYVAFVLMAASLLKAGISDVL